MRLSTIARLLVVMLMPEFVMVSTVEAHCQTLRTQYNTEAKTRRYWMETRPGWVNKEVKAEDLHCYRSVQEDEERWNCEEKPGECAEHWRELPALRKQLEHLQSQWGPRPVPTWPQYFQDMNGRVYRCDPAIVGGCWPLY